MKIVASPPSSSRRTVSELRTFYRLYPQEKEVIVEARSDRQLVQWFLREAGITNVPVHAVDDRVDIPSALVAATDTDAGVRGRVVALAVEASSWALVQENITCIVDADRHFLETASIPSSLLQTDVGSIEVYTVRPRPFRQFLSNVLSIDDDPEQVLDDVVPVLQASFYARAALHKQSIAPIEKFTTCYEVSARENYFNVEEFIRRSLSIAKMGSLQGEVMADYERLTMVRSNDPLQAIRGHDIAPTLAKRLGLRNDWAKPEVIERSMRGCLSMADLTSERLFLELLNRVGGKPASVNV